MALLHYIGGTDARADGRRRWVPSFDAKNVSAQFYLRCLGFSISGRRSVILRFGGIYKPQHFSTARALGCLISADCGLRIVNIWEYKLVVQCAFKAFLQAQIDSALLG
jgi:hypothetical protein